MHMPNIQNIKVKMRANGRVVIPAKVRRALGVKESADFNLTYTDEHVVLTPSRRAWEELRDYVAPAKPKPGDELMSEQLMRERRAEATRENI